MESSGVALFFALITLFSFIIVSVIIYIKYKTFKDDTEKMHTALDGRTASNDARHDANISGVQSIIRDMSKSFSTRSLDVSGASFSYSNNTFTIKHPNSNVAIHMNSDNVFFDGPIRTSNHIYAEMGIATPGVLAEDVYASFIGAENAMGAPLIVGNQSQIDVMDAMDIKTTTISASNGSFANVDLASKWSLTDQGDEWLHVIAKDTSVRAGIAADGLLVNQDATIKGGVNVEGDVSASGMLRAGPANKWPASLSNTQGGVHAWDVYANDSIAAGKDGDIAAYFNSSGSIVGQNISTAAGVSITNADPGPLIEKSYGSSGNRYGVGQFPSGTTRLYASDDMAFASVNLSFAKGDGSFGDVVKVSKDGSSFKTSVTDGKLCVQDTCISKAALDKIVETSGAAGL